MHGTLCRSVDVAKIDVNCRSSFYLVVFLTYLSFCWIDERTKTNCRAVINRTISYEWANKDCVHVLVGVGYTWRATSLNLLVFWCWILRYFNIYWSNYDCTNIVANVFFFNLCFVFVLFLCVCVHICKRLWAMTWDDSISTIIDTYIYICSDILKHLQAKHASSLFRVCIKKAYDLYLYDYLTRVRRYASCFCLFTSLFSTNRCFSFFFYTNLCLRNHTTWTLHSLFNWNWINPKTKLISLNLTAISIDDMNNHSRLSPRSYRSQNNLA